jgi:mannitol/fructose-specific phosphotransferase system IIA component (Ntr-type)
LLLTDMLSPERIRLSLESRLKDDLLRELVDALVSANGTGDAERVLRAVREREAVLSTGIGHGVAIPHAKSADIGELSMVVGRTAEPVEFDALDGEPVSLFFLLVGPESASGSHIKTLSRLSRLLRRNDVRARLVAARSPEDFFQTLREAEGA